MVEERNQTAKTVGKTIMLKRRELGISQMELAKILGVKQGMVSRWERGESPLKGPYTKAVAEALSVPVVDLIVNVFPEKERKPRVSKDNFIDFLKSVPVVGAASAGHRLEMTPSQAKESLRKQAWFCLAFLRSPKVFGRDSACKMYARFRRVGKGKCFCGYICGKIRRF